jgi:tetratricopeptide (TPR) repeat protein
MQARTLALLAIVAAAPAVAHADGAHLKPEAQAHLDSALKAYAAKDWDGAIREFQAAYAIDPSPALIYATAQAYRFENKCREAIDYYKKYLAIASSCASAPDRAVCEAQITAANTGITTCESTLEKTSPPVEPPKSVTPPAPPPQSEPAPHVEVTATVESPWYKDPMGDALAVGGVIGIGVGIGFLVEANSTESKAKSATLRNDFVKGLGDATSERQVGFVALGAGVALAAGSVWFYVRHDNKSHVVATTDGHSLTIAGSF